MPNRLSYTKVTTYSECGRKYKFHYVDRLRPKKIKSPLAFGKAIDSGMNALLEGKSLEEANDVFIQHWTNTDVNGKMCPVNLDTISFSKTDEELAEGDPWTSLKLKGIIILKTYKEEVMPRIKRVIKIQEPIMIKNDEGDFIEGFIDFIAEMDDGKVYILDNKTTSVPYEDDSALKSPQLNLYFFAKRDTFKLNGVGYITLSKRLNRSRKVTCHDCGNIYYPNRPHRCPKCKGNNQTIELLYKCQVKFILSEIKDVHIDDVLELFDKTNNQVLVNDFTPNWNSCKNKYGYCQYYKLCHEGDDSELVVLDTPSTR